MTLKELSAQVTGTKKKDGMSRSELLNSGSPAIAIGSHNNGSVSVFQNGYILYSECHYFTVFHISEVCGKNAQYNTVDKDVPYSDARIIGADYLENLEWILPITMWGNGRIIHNLNVRENDHRDFRYSGVPEDWDDIACVYEDSPYEEVEDADEAQHAIDEIKIRIVPTQWSVFVGKVVDGLSEEQLATTLNISQQAVSKRYKKAISNIRRVKRDLPNKENKDE